MSNLEGAVDIALLILSGMYLSDVIEAAIDKQWKRAAYKVLLTSWLIIAALW